MPDPEPTLSRRTLLFLAALLPLLASGCGSPPDQPLRIGTNLWPGYEPLYLARSLDLLDPRAIRLVDHSSATQVLQSFRNGSLEGAALTLDETLMLLENGLDVVVVLVMDISNGADVILGQPELTDIKAIKGRRVGFESTALGAFLLSRALDAAGLTPRDIISLPMPVDEHQRAFEEQRVDAVVTFEPVRSKLLAQGARPLFDSSAIPGEIVDVLTVRREVVKNRPDALAQMLKGWFQALDHLHLHPRKSAKLVAKRLGVDEDTFLTSLGGLHFPSLEENRELLGSTRGHLLESLRKLHRVMLEHKLLGKAVPLERLLDGQPVTRLTP